MRSRRAAAWSIALVILAVVNAPANARQTSDATTVLSGSVVREVDGSPLVGSVVRLQRPVRIRGCATGWAFSVPSTLEFDETDAEGRFRFELEGPLGLHSLVVMPTADTGVGRITLGTRLSHELAAGASADVECVAPPHCSVTGRTLDERGIPVPGARVMAWHAFKIHDADRRFIEPDVVVTSDALGHFHIPTLGSHAQIEIEADGYVPSHSLSFGVSPGEHMRGLRLVLHRERFIEGRVVDEEGKECAGLSVTARRERFSADEELGEWPGVRRIARTTWAGCETEADGTFRLGPLPNDTVSLTIPGEPFLPWESSVDTDSIPLSITLERGARLTGIVRDIRGRPVAGADVQTLAFTALPDPGFNPGRDLTDADGVYEFLGVPLSENVVVTVKAPGYAWTVVDDVVIPDAGMYARDITLEPAQRLSVRILTPEGEPYSHKSIAWRGDRVVETRPELNRVWKLHGHASISWNDYLDRRDAFTDEDGAFTIDALHAGEYTLYIRPYLQLFRLAPGQETVDIHLAPVDTLRRRLLGHVVDADIGEGLDDYEVTVQRGSRGSREPDPIERTEDRFILEVGRGNSRVWVTAPGRAFWVESFVGDDAVDFVRTIELPRACRLTVRVVDNEGTPVLMTNVAISGEHAQLVLFEGNGHRIHGFTRVDRNGSLAADRLPPGILTVTASVPDPEHGWAIAAKGTIDATDATHPHELELVIDRP